VSNDFETEEATNAYLAQHPNAPARSLQEILLSGQVNPWRARGLIGYVGKSTRDPGYLTVLQQREALRVSVLQVMADQRLTAIVYATYDAPPTVIAPDVLTNPRPNDGYSRGDNRGLSPSIGFPALTVPAGFSDNTLPVGIEFLGRPFSEAELLAIGFAYEQRTKHRRPPSTAPALSRD
jgi:amidase